MVPEEQSYAESGLVLKATKPMIEMIYGGKVSNYMLRKVAHFTEYAVLGGLLACLALWSDIKWRAAFVLGAGVGIACVDETIQIFSGRNSQIRDVMIDLSGVAVACAIVFAADLFWKWIQKKRIWLYLK